MYYLLGAGETIAKSGRHIETNSSKERRARIGVGLAGLVVIGGFVALASMFKDDGVLGYGSVEDTGGITEDKRAENARVIIKECAFAVPGEKRRIWDDFWQKWSDEHEINYPSNTEKCVILDGENLEKIYEDLLLLLPERKSIAQVKAEFGDDFSNKEKVLEEFQQLAPSADLTVLIQNIQNEISCWTNWIKGNQVEKKFGEEYLVILSQKLSILEEASRIRKQEQLVEQKKKNSDNGGEKSVEYIINWFTANYSGLIVSIIADCESAYRYNCILLEKPDFIKESQEYDHILIGPGGVLLIETKHWKGTVEIRSDGKWIRYKDEEHRVGIESPKNQIWRHEALMKAIVPDITVSSVLCFSNADVVIEGKEHFIDYPIVYVDQLNDYLDQFYRNKLYSEEDIRLIVKTIESHKVNRMSKQ